MTALRGGRLLLFVLVFAAIWFGTLDYRRLVNPDEGRYAEIPREMVASGDWTTPRLNGFKYFEKPPLQYWTTAIAYETLGEAQWTSRLWTALTGFLGVLITGYAATRLFGGTVGMLGAAVLGSSLLWTLMGHINTLDMGVSAFLAAAVFALCLAERDGATRRESQLWRDGAWGLLALAILSKGLIGAALPGLAVFVYAAWQRDWGLIARMRPLRGLVILFLITSPWFLAVSLANPEFPRFFFIHEHFERFLTKAHGRYQPPWYFIPILLTGLLPWTLTLFAALRHGLRGEKSPARGRFDAGRFLSVWAICVFVFFSASSSKLASYILPIFPALAVLLAVVLAKAIERGTLRRHLLPGLLAALLIPFLIEFAERFSKSEALAHAGYDRYEAFLYAAAAVLLAGAVIAWRAARRQGILAVLAMSFAAHLSGQLVLLGHDNIGFLKSAHDIAGQVRDKIPADAPLYSVGTYDQTLQFYLGRTSTMVAYRDELAFGIEQEPAKFLNSLTDFEHRWHADAIAYAFMEPGQFDAYRAASFPMVEIARDPRRVIVRKP